MMSTINLIIRQAAASDAKILADLGARTFSEAYSDVKKADDIKQYITTAFVSDEIRLSIEEHYAIFFIASNDTSPIGYVKLRWDRTHQNLDSISRNLELERIYVLKNYWKHRIGAALMLHAIDYARQTGYHFLWLGVWQQNNRAIDFYLKMGFEIFGTKKFYVGEEENDDYVMRLKL